MIHRISLDPGSTAIGVAVWSPFKTTWSLSWVGNLYPDRETKDLSVFHKIDSLMRKLESDIYDNFEFDTCYCEVPTYFESNRGQQVAASGDLIKLTLSVGAIGEFCRTKNIVFEPIRVIDWRGQLPESVMQQRVRKVFSEEFMQQLNPKSHSYDAIGIGVYALTGEAI